MASQANFQRSIPTFHVRTNLQPRYPHAPPHHINLTKSTRVRFPVIRASSPSNHKPSLLKTTFITLTATASLFSALYLVSKPAVTRVTNEASLEKRLETESNVVEALLSLAKIKFDSDKHDQAVEIMNRLIEIEPDENRWPAMKARILSYHGQSESAIKAFEEILLKDPNRVDAYHYLVMELYNSKPKLTELETRINEAIRRCKKTKEVCGLRMLIAQIKVVEGNTLEAIRICEKVVKDDPKDFRVYLFQGLVYSLMKKGDEAAKQFEHVARLLLDDPYIVTATVNNAKKVSEWRVIVGYDSVYCYLTTFAKLLIVSALEKFS